MIPIVIHQCYTYGIFVVSILTNLSFICISATTINDQIGRYRYLMICFTITDILVSLTHIVLMPGIQLTPVGYIFIGYHMVDMPAVYGHWAGIFFVIFFYQTFIILAFHYIYRYAVVCEPRWRTIFPSYKTFWWTLTATLVQNAWTYGYYKSVRVAFMPSEAKTAYYCPILLNNTGIDCMRVGYLAIMIRSPSVGNKRGEWQMDAIGAMVTGLSLSALSITIIVTCSLLMLRKLKHAGTGLVSAQVRATQHQLLKALIVQTAIPTVFSYIPLAIILVIPLIGLDFNGVYGDVMVMLTALFPAIDPVIMIYFVRSYRTRAVQWWRGMTMQTSVSQVEHLQLSFTTESRPS